MEQDKKSTHLRFLHIADVHLDTPFAGLSADKSEERRRELRATFTKMIQYVRDRKIDVVLIAGDLFESTTVTNTTVEVLISQFMSCPDSVFIIAPGKHDSYKDNPVYTSGRLPSNCHVFSEDGLSRFDFDKFNVTVYGWAFTSPEKCDNPLFGHQVDDPSRVNIVTGYCDLDGEVDSVLCPISREDLSKFGADYYALGSRHEATDFAKLNDSIYSYCGAPSSTGFEEPGIGGANLIVFDADDEGLSVDVKRLPFAHLRFAKESLDITGVDSNNEIVTRISKLIGERSFGIETALRIELVGNIPPKFIIPKTLDSEAFGLYFFDLADKTLPLFGAEHYAKDMTTAGVVYRRLLPLMKSEDEEERLTAARAFRVALAALEGREIDL